MREIEGLESVLPSFEHRPLAPMENTCNRNNNNTNKHVTMSEHF